MTPEERQITEARIKNAHIQGQLDQLIAQLKRAPKSNRERWRYDGRQPWGPDGTECYRWIRHLRKPEPTTGFTHYVYWHPVNTFWPS